MPIIKIADKPTQDNIAKSVSYVKENIGGGLVLSPVEPIIMESNTTGYATMSTSYSAKYGGSLYMTLRSTSSLYNQFTVEADGISKLAPTHYTVSASYYATVGYPFASSFAITENFRWTKSDTVYIEAYRKV